MAREIPTQERGRARSPSAPHGEGARPHAPQAGRAVVPRPPQLVRLGDVCEIVSGSTPKTSVESYWGGSFPWITPAELNDKTVVVGDTARHLSEEGVSSAALKPFPAGTVLLSSRAPIGKVAIAGCDMYCNQGFKNLICSDAIHNFYLYYWLKSHTSFLNSLGRGATFKEISKAIVAQIQIPLPPLPEQKRIAAILDKICEMKRNAEARLQKLDLLVKARFVEMFGDPLENPLGFTIVALKELTTKIGSGATPKGGKESYRAEGVSLIRSMNVHDGSFKYIDLAHLSDKQAQELNNVTVQSTDVLVNITGASVARSCIVPDDVLPARVNQHVAIIRPNDKVLPLYLNRLFIYPSFKRLLLGIGESGGATRQAITKQQLEMLRIPLPPLALQRQFAAFVEKVEGLKATAKKELEQVDLLYRAKLQEFFG